MGIITLLFFFGISFLLVGLITFYRANAFMTEVKQIKSDIDEFRGQLILLASQRKRRR